MHAHPDDESTATGGILAHYAARGVRVVVVTCTDGDLGDGHDGSKPGMDGHDPKKVAAVRRTELRAACARLGVTDLELLGYHDSGMLDWGHRYRPDVFCNVPLDLVATRLVGIFERYRPQVVVTYDPEAIYQHPDHTHTARSTVRAVERAGAAAPAKFYAKAHGSDYWAKLRRTLAQLGVDYPAPAPDQTRVLERIQARVTTVVQTGHVADLKRSALHAHESQLGSSLAAKIPDKLFGDVFGVETYIRLRDATGAPLPEDDLFLGL